MDFKNLETYMMYISNELFYYEYTIHNRYLSEYIDLTEEEFIEQIQYNFDREKSIKGILNQFSLIREAKDVKMIKDFENFLEDFILSKEYYDKILKLNYQYVVRNKEV